MKFPVLGNVCAPSAVGIETRDVPKPPSQEERRSYGVLYGGVELMHQAWGNLNHIFSVRSHNDPRKGDPIIDHGHFLDGFGQNTLNVNPVDLLVVEQGMAIQPPERFRRYEWEDVIDKTRTKRRPKIVIESWLSGSHLWSRDP